MLIEQSLTLPAVLEKDIKSDSWAWETPGLHVESGLIPKDAHVTKTFILKKVNKPFMVCVEFSLDTELSINIKFICKSFDIEEIKKKFPKLFEQIGDLYHIV